MMETAIYIDNRDTEDMLSCLQAEVKSLRRRLRELEALTDGGYREQGK